MASKQDGVSPRTASDIERKYNFGKSFAEVMGYASTAQKAAETAQEAANKANQALDGLDQEAIFNLLTNNGEVEGIYRTEDGQVYINASYIKSGILKSLNGDMYFDLENGIINTVQTVLGGVDATRRFAIHSQGMTALEEYSDGSRQEVFSVVFKPVHSSAAFSTVITDDKSGGENPRGIAVQGVGGTGLGSTSSDTYIFGKKIYLVDENTSSTNLYTFIQKVTEALGL